MNQKLLRAIRTRKAAPSLPEDKETLDILN
jgi:hypothetical protein